MAAPMQRRPPLRIRIAWNLITAFVWTTYAGLGMVTATAYGYLDIDRAAAGPVVSAVLAVVCWPAVYMGVSVRL